MKRVKTHTVLQMEAAECGAAALGIILAHHGVFLPLEHLRVECGVGRDGANANNILKAARKHGLNARAFRAEPAQLRMLPPPLIAHWNFNHFVVLEGFDKQHAYLNDPAIGRIRVAHDELDRAFTGVVLAFDRTPEFRREGAPWSALAALKSRLAGSHRALSFIVLIGLCLVVPGLVIPSFTRIFIDEIVIAGQKSWLPGLFAAIAFTLAIQTILVSLQKKYILRLENKIAIAGASRFLWHLLQLPTRFYLQRSAGELASRVGSHDQLAQIAAGRLANSALGLLLIAFYACLMVQYDVVLTVIALGVGAGELLVLRSFSRAQRDANARLSLERGVLAGVSMNGLALIETIKAAAAEGEFFSHWAGHYARVQTAHQKAQSTAQLVASLPALMNAMCFALVLGIGGLRVMHAEMSIGMLLAFQTLLAGMLAPMHELFALGGELQEAEGELRRVDDITSHRPDQRFVVAPAIENDLTPPIGEVTIDGLTFGHSVHEAPLFKELQLTFAPGQRVALVGRSGSGKSSLGRVVAGLAEPWSGSIKIDGVSRNDRRAEWFGYVDQQVMLFEGTVFDNLTLWDPTTPEARVVQAAKDACIHDDIVARPGGYASVIEEGGRNLSGGQRQRLEIARALVHDPAVLVLDEATSALDPVTERALNDNLRRRGCTCLIIAHRSSTIRDADEIIVLDAGRVVQRGSHDQLRAADGLYARLIERD